MDVLGIAGMVFGAAVLSLWLVTLAVPMRYFAPSITSFLLLAAIYHEWPFDHHPQGLRYSSGNNALLTAIFEFMVAAIGYKLLMVGLVWAAHGRGRRNRGSTEQAAPSARHHETLFARVMMIGTGAIAGVCLVSTFAATAVHWHPSWLAHALTIAPAIVIGAFTPLCVRRLRLGPQVHDFAAGLRWSVVAVTVALGAFIFWSIGRVVDRAELAAHSLPYCIVITDWRGAHWDRPDNHMFFLGYRPASALLDLSPLTMRAPCDNDRCYQNHAALSIGDAKMPSARQVLWSYRRQDFFNDDGDSGAGKPSCSRSSIVRTLPFL